VTRWFRRSEEFNHWVRLRERLDQRTLAFECFAGKGASERAAVVPADAWLDGRLLEDARVVENTRCMPSYAGALTLLWLPKAIDAGRPRQDEDLAELDPEEFGFRRKRWPCKR
jgi:hypothetical protein